MQNSSPIKLKQIVYSGTKPEWPQPGNVASVYLKCDVLVWQQFYEVLLQQDQESRMPRHFSATLVETLGRQDAAMQGELL